MHRREDDDDSSLHPPGICRRLFRIVVAKLGILGEKENKLIKKGSRSDITIHFKQIEDSEDSSKHKNNSPGSSSQESERETVITLANGSNNGTKKRLHEKGKKSEPSPKAKPEAVKPPPQPPKPHHRGLMPLLNDINKKSDAFIESTLEKMRKNL